MVQESICPLSRSVGRRDVWTSKRGDNATDGLADGRRMDDVRARFGQLLSRPETPVAELLDSIR